MTRIVIYVHHYKQPPEKKPKAPTIAQTVVISQHTDGKPKAAPALAKKSAIVTSVGRKEAKSLHWHERHASDDAERDDDTDKGTHRAHRAWIARTRKRK